MSAPATHVRLCLGPDTRMRDSEDPPVAPAAMLEVTAATALPLPVLAAMRMQVVGVVAQVAMLQVTVSAFRLTSFVVNQRSNEILLFYFAQDLPM